MAFQNIDSLVEIPHEKWPSIMDMFKTEWPYGLTAWSTLSTQYTNVKKYPDFPVKLFAPYGDFKEGIVFIFKLIPFATEIAMYVLKDDCDSLKRSMLESKRLDWCERIFFRSITENLVKCAHEILKIKNVAFNEVYTYITFTDKERAKEFDVDIPEGHSITSGSERHAKDVDESWPFRYPGSEEYFKKLINWGYASVLLGPGGDADIRAWIFISVRGEMHSLYVKEEYRRRGYAVLLLKYLSKKLANEGQEVFAGVVTTNEPSKRMFECLDFQRLHVTTWIDSK